MLEDCVFLSPAPDADLPAVGKAMGLLKGLVGKVDGMIDFASGPNREFESKSGIIAVVSSSLSRIAMHIWPMSAIPIPPKPEGS